MQVQSVQEDSLENDRDLCRGDLSALPADRRTFRIAAAERAKSPALSKSPADALGTARDLLLSPASCRGPEQLEVPVPHPTTQLRQEPGPGARTPLGTRALPPGHVSRSRLHFPDMLFLLPGLN